MRILVSAALVAAQVATAAQPAFAAEIQRETTVATGTFGGLRLRVPLDGGRNERAPRLGLAFAPAVHAMGEDGAARLRIGEGLEFGFSGRHRTLALSVAGRRLAAVQDNEDEREDDGTDLDTGEAILIGVGAIILVGAAGFLYLISNIEGE